VPVNIFVILRASQGVPFLCECSCQSPLNIWNINRVQHWRVVFSSSFLFPLLAAAAGRAVHHRVRARMSVAVWLPLDQQAWQDHQHYILSCDWAVLALSSAPVPMYGWSSATGPDAISTTAATALSAMAIVLSLAAVFVSDCSWGWWVPEIEALGSLKT